MKIDEEEEMIDCSDHILITVVLRLEQNKKYTKGKWRECKFYEKRRDNGRIRKVTERQMERNK